MLCINKCARAAKPKPKSWRERIAECDTVESLGEIGNQVDEAESNQKLTPEQADQLRDLIGTRHNQLEPQEVPS